MNVKTTITLAIVTGAGALAWLILALTSGDNPQESPALDALQQLKQAKINKIEIKEGKNEFVLEKKDNEWWLPGNWPARQREVEDLVQLVTSIKTRFAPVPLTDDKADRYGVGRDAVVVRVHAGEHTFTLRFGEEANDTNRFSRPTWLRINDHKEVIRLAPGLIRRFKLPVDYFHQRRLFAVKQEVEAKDDTASEKLDADQLTITMGDQSLTLKRTANDWVLEKPVKDRVEPDKLKELLTTIPDIWAETFVRDKSLDECGLDKPEQSLTVKGPDGNELTLLIGKRSQMKTRTVLETPPPNPRMPIPPKPTPKIIHEEYKYAKLKDNEQIFEVKADKFKNVFVSASELRDPKLARFDTFDVTQVDITSADKNIRLVKKDNDWRMQKPKERDADDSKVRDLLSKLADLEAKGDDIIDGAEPKKYGFDDKSVVSVKITVETGKEGDGDAARKSKKETKTFVFRFGKRDSAKNKLYVRVDGWERINAVDDKDSDVSKLVQRDALAYRGLRIVDATSSELTRIEVTRGKDRFILEREGDRWELIEPSGGMADKEKANSLVSDLALLEAVEFIDDKASKEELIKYGLAEPALTAVITYKKDDKKETKILLVGAERGDREEYYAKLSGEDDVFVIKKDIRDALDKGSLAFLPLKPWELKSPDIASLELKVAGTDDYRLQRREQDWQIVGPFSALADSSAVEQLLKSVTDLKADRYVALAANNPAEYGFDQPYVRLRIHTKDEAQTNRTHLAQASGVFSAGGLGPIFLLPYVGFKDPGLGLIIGKPADKEGKTRYARLTTRPAVFVVGDTLVSSLAQKPLDLLNRDVARFPDNLIGQVKLTRGSNTTTLRKEKDGWLVQAVGLQFKGDPLVIDNLLDVCSFIKAKRYVAYGDQVDLAAYGLDKPFAVVDVGPTESKAMDVANHLGRIGSSLSASLGGTFLPPVLFTYRPKITVLIGKPTADNSRERFAKLEGHAGVFVLSANDARALTGGYLDFVNHDLLSFDADKVTGFARSMKENDLKLVKKDDLWYIETPQQFDADSDTIADLLRQLSALRASQVAAYRAKDLKQFALDPPEAVITLTIDGKKRVLKLGKNTRTDEGQGGRFAVVDGSDVVGVIADPLASRLTAVPLKFRNRDLARLVDADRLELTYRGIVPRKAAFSKIAGTWKMTSPAKADASQNKIEEFINTVSRLRADELVADKSEAAKFGLEKPFIRWQFQLDGQVVLDLLVGDKEKDGSRRYARLANGDLVFLLSARLTEQVESEYRKQELWSSFDSNTVEALRYKFLDGTSFQLSKSGGEWQIEGKAGVKVDATKVNDTLDALIRLKAARFVVDKDADLKQFGLDPPNVAIEVQVTLSDQRRLHIGRREGESKRHYARLADDKEKAVFVISEDDAQRIIRKLADFQAK
ncbi:MAG: hypothetical protein KatS3mg105_0290 [Gemmatales bacterium]|nr:MAG: hypothetical protein KatS3mg105_0290 [Gemmatales bacterium]